MFLRYGIVGFDGKLCSISVYPHGAQSVQLEEEKGKGPFARLCVEQVQQEATTRQDRTLLFESYHHGIAPW